MHKPEATRGRGRTPDRPGTERGAASRGLARGAVPGATAVSPPGPGHRTRPDPGNRALAALRLRRGAELDEVEKTVHDLLARVARPKWSGDAVKSLPLVARILARAGKTKTALLLLDQAAGEGYYDLRKAQSDPAFRELCQTKAYQQLLKKLAK